MRCPKCQYSDDKVIDSRLSQEGDVIRRRRECLSCGYRFTTYEQIERLEWIVIKRDGCREEFDTKKLLGSFIKACQKRPISIAQMEEVVERVTQELAQSQQREIPTKLIGEAVMAELRNIDPVAYVRYASVYRCFEEVGEFLEEIQALS